MALNADISFVCAVESGALEAQTVRLVESLRMFGGRFANAAVFAVTPRFGPPISAATRRLFSKYDVTHIQRTFPSRYAWFNYYNKPLALIAAEEHVTTGSIGFLDSDLLIVQEPELLQLENANSFLAFPVECKEMGTKGASDPLEGLWQSACKTLGMNLESIPWIVTAQTGERIRQYFNSGIFVYGAQSGFSKAYLDLTTRLLDARIGTKASGYHDGFKEQVSIMFASRQLGLSWQPLPYSYNYPMSSLTHEDWYSPAALRNARVVHYHDAMWPHFWDTFIDCMRETHPVVHDWLLTLGPMQNFAPYPYRALSKIVRWQRQRQAMKYTASCTQT